VELKVFLEDTQSSGIAPIVEIDCVISEIIRINKLKTAVLKGLVNNF